MKRLLMTGVSLALSIGMSYAQQHRECATMHVHEAQMEANPKYAEKMHQIEEHTNRVLKNQLQARNEVTGVITIPVVVHVVYNTSAENISDAQINDQMRIINEDFRATNSDFNQVPSLFAGRAADSEFEFVLDQIVRVSTSTSSFSSNDAMKRSSSGGSDAISPNTKLNMWVCDLSGGLLGYAQFPGGNPATDGVVMDYQYFGSIGTATAPFDLGRTTTHEIGHWLNLRHIWGDGNCSADDFVSDTPVMGGSNGGCPTFGINSCNEGTGDEPDMFMNYMDYVNDACMFMFTEGQKSRMRAIFEPGGARESFLGGGGGSLPCTNPVDGDVTLTLVTDNYGSETSWSLTDSVGNTVASGSGYGNNQTINETFTGLVGPHQFTIFDSYGDGICCAYGNGSYELKDGNGNTIASGGSFASSESTVFCVNGGGGGPTNNAPVAAAGGPYSGDQGAAISFDASGSTDADGDALTYSWDFGDGSNGSGVSPSHTYATAGSYTATVTVSDGTDSDQASASVTVNSVGGGGSTVLFESYFETGLDGWVDGGSDCFRYTGGRSYEGTYSIRLRDNTNSSVMTRSGVDASPYASLAIEFYFYPNSMESGEDFWLQVNNGSGWNTVATYVSGTDFTNNSFYSSTINVPASAIGSNGAIRFRNDASANNDRVYIDAVTVTGITAGSRSGATGVTLVETGPIVPAFELDAPEGITLFPNPTSGFATASFALDHADMVTISVFSMTGQELQARVHSLEAGQHSVGMDLNGLQPGMYLVRVQGTELQEVQRLVVR